MRDLEMETHSPRPILYLWDDRSLSFGGNSQLAPHHHGAAELIVALEKPFMSRLQNGQCVTTRSLLIPPNTQHQNIHQDPICPILYLDAEGKDYRLITSLLEQNAGVFQDLALEKRAGDIFRKIYREQPSAEECYELIQEALFDLRRPVRPLLDPRIGKIIAIIKDNLSENHSIEYLAAEIELSTDRLMHLFSAQVGIPLRKYRAWARLKEATKLYFAGNNLTTAAHAVGFADSAHYTKTFRKYFGTTPSDLLSKRKNLTVFFG